MTFLNYRDLSRDVLKLVPFCLENEISAIYGVPRSGMLPATMLAAALQLPLGMPGTAPVYGRRVLKRPRKGEGPILVLEDTVNSGNGMMVAKGLMPDPRYLTACVYTKPESAHLVDIAARVIEGPRLYEWNFMNCDLTRRMMFDMDGVFCHDPTVFDDDGPEYEEAISHAIPKYLSTWPVGWIATNRIDRWATVTMDWIEAHGIDLLNCILMQPFNTAAARRKSSTSAGFKAQCYQSAPDCVLFVESHDKLAEHIYRLVNRPVLAVDSMRLYS